MGGYKSLLLQIKIYFNLKQLKNIIILPCASRIRQPLPVLGGAATLTLLLVLLKVMS